MIYYAAIAHGGVIIVSQQKKGGNFEETAQNIFKNHSGDGGTNSVTYAANRENFHCLMKNGWIFLCTTDSGYAKQRAYAFLESVQKKFDSRGAGTSNRDFGVTLSQEMDFFSTAEPDKLKMLNSQVDEVKTVLVQNIERVMERGERLDDLMAKTEDLEAGATQFRTTGRNLSRKMWWRNVKMMIILGLVVGLILLLIILAATGVIG